ncbi:glyoxalase [Rhodanobacter sp. B05]|uniref:VOC family protein n=1 Tax=Rhodanobacter sp. B05 TaxID=1945859 RepID=UPI000985638A|nr:VOC family protein [Rhodanobacter sp. B05]OOG54642.1 glyoxalase [Rhodanobacter sp. B05]
MHRSRLCSLIIDCHANDLGDAARFWSQALGRPVKAGTDTTQEKYIGLVTHDDEPVIELQKVEHPSRVHLDIESDDIEAEVRRLEALGARKVEAIQTWVVMEAPTGHRFCVVRPQRGGMGAHGNQWT